MAEETQRHCSLHSSLSKPRRAGVLPAPELRWFSVHSGCRLVGSGASFFVLLASEFPPSLLPSVWTPGVFHVPGELGSAEERECVIGIPVVPCGENRYEFKNGNVCKRLWGQS